MKIKIQSPFKLTKSANKSINEGNESPLLIPVGASWNGFASDLSRSKMLEYFLTIPELFSIITTKAKMHSNMRIVNANDSEAPNKYIDILSNPNFHQGRNEFFIQTKIYREIYGNEYIYIPTPVGFSGSIKQLNSLDPSRLELEDKKFSEPVFLMTELPEVNYKYTEDGKTYPIPNTQVLHINNPVVNKGNTFAESVTGLSTVSAVSTALANMNGAYESRGKLIHNRGPLNILSNDSKDALGSAGIMNPKSKEDLQKDFSKYGMLKDQWSTIITNLSLKSNVIGSNVKELMLFEETEADFQVLLGAFGLKREIFPSVKGATFENQKEAIKSGYTDTIIPEAQEWIGAFNNRWKLTGTKDEMKVDFSHLPIFDTDLKDRGIALLQNAKALQTLLEIGGLEQSQIVEESNKLIE